MIVKYGEKVVVNIVQLALREIINLQSDYLQSLLTLKFEQN